MMWHPSDLSASCVAPADSTVLTSTFYCLLRLLRPMLDAPHIQGAGFTFAAGMFLQVLIHYTRSIHT